jgi:DNA-binding transcriptional LysR family regulator
MAEFTIVGLRVVREAARYGSFSTAAERLGYTQSAVSRQIGLMEQAAGRALFVRHARGVAPTAAGKAVLLRAEAVLGEIEAARQDLHALDAGPPARLHIGAFSTAMAALVPRALADLAEQKPHARMLLREGLSARLLIAVARGRIDAAVVNRPQDTPADIEMIPLLDDPLLLAIPSDHVFTGQTSVKPEELTNEPWIAGSAERGTTLLGAWSDSSWQPHIAFVAKDWVAKLGLVAAGLGVTVIPGIAAPTVPSGIALVRIDHPSAQRTTALVQRQGIPDEPLLRLFTEALRDAAADLSAELRRRIR